MPDAVSLLWIVLLSLMPFVYTAAIDRLLAPLRPTARRSRLMRWNGVVLVALVPLVALNLAWNRWMAAGDAAQYIALSCSTAGDACAELQANAEALAMDAAVRRVMPLASCTLPSAALCEASSTLVFIEPYATSGRSAILGGLLYSGLAVALPATYVWLRRTRPVSVPAADPVGRQPLPEPSQPSAAER